LAEEKRLKEKHEFEVFMQTPKFCLAGESSDPNLIPLPIEEPLDDNPSDQSHPNTTANQLNPE